MFSNSTSLSVEISEMPSRRTIVGNLYYRGNECVSETYGIMYRLATNMQKHTRDKRKMDRSGATSRRNSVEHSRESQAL